MFYFYNLKFINDIPHFGLSLKMLFNDLKREIMHITTNTHLISTNSSNFSPELLAMAFIKKTSY